MGASISAAIWTGVTIMSVSTSLDNFSVATSYAISKKRFTHRGLLAISIFSAATSGGCMFLGDLVYKVLPESATMILASTIFFVLGAKEFWDCFQVPSLIHHFCNRSLKYAKPLTAEVLNGHIASEGVRNTTSTSEFDMQVDSIEQGMSLDLVADLGDTRRNYNCIGDNNSNSNSNISSNSDSSNSDSSNNGGMEIDELGLGLEMPMIKEKRDAKLNFSTTNTKLTLSGSSLLAAPSDMTHDLEKAQVQVNLIVDMDNACEDDAESGDFSMGSVIGSDVSCSIIEPQHSDHSVSLGMPNTPNKVVQGYVLNVDSKLSISADYDDDLFISKRLMTTKRVGPPHLFLRQSSQITADTIDESVENESNAPEEGDVTTNENKDEQIVSWQLILVLSFACSVSNMAGGIAAGVANWPILPVTLGSFFVSWFMMEMGQMTGRSLAKFIPEKYLIALSGCGLVAVGLDQLNLFGG